MIQYNLTDEEWALVLAHRHKKYDVIREFVGHQLMGVLSEDLHQGVKTLVFSDGRGLSFMTTGYWIEPKSKLLLDLEENRELLGKSKPPNPP